MESEATKNQRKKELEEMKRRIAEYKEKNKNAQSSKTAAKPAAASATGTTSSPQTQAMDFDDIINSVEHMVPNASPTPLSPAIQSTSTTTTSPKQDGQKEDDLLRKYKPVLTIQSLLIDIDIPPKEIPMYSKGTQTVEPEPLTEEELALRMSSQTPVKGKFKYPQIQTTSTTNLQSSTSSQPQHNQGTDAQEVVEESGASDEPEIIELNEQDKVKILESDSFKSFFSRSSKVIERALFLDDSVDILVDYTKLDEEDKSSSKELRLMGTLNDERWSKHRSVTDINWSPKHPELVVTSYSANEAGSHDPDGVVLVWSVNNYFQKPEYVFNCQSPVMTTFFSRFHPTLIVGGTYSGQIVIWDTRSKSTPVQRTPLSSVGHTHPVYSMSVVGSTNANSLVSISTDGKLCSWNLENLNAPIETLDLNSKSSSSVSAASSIAVTSLVFHENEMNAFYVGTEEGAIYSANRHGTKAGVADRYKGHYGPITSLDLHPSKGSVDFSNLFVSSSTDWSVKLWASGKTDAPIYSFDDYVDYVYDARWSPAHPAVLATGDGTGQLCVWDLNEDTEAPIYRSKTSTRSLNRLSWSADGKRLLVGDSGGQLSLYDSSQFANPQADEWTKFGNVINKLTSKPLSLQQDSPILGSNISHDD
eukprot:gene13688-16125_t